MRYDFTENVSNFLLIWAVRYRVPCLYRYIYL